MAFLLRCVKCNPLRHSLQSQPHRFSYLGLGGRQIHNSYSLGESESMSEMRVMKERGAHMEKEMMRLENKVNSLEERQGRLSVHVAVVNTKSNVFILLLASILVTVGGSILAEYTATFKEGGRRSSLKGFDKPGNDGSDKPGNDADKPGNDGSDKPGNDVADKPGNDGSDKPGNDVARKSEETKKKSE